MYFTQAIAVAVLAYTAVAAPAGPTCASRDSVCRKYTANNGLSQVECDVAIAQCIGACQVPFDACQVAPDANHSACAAQLVACTGVSYEDSIKPQSAVGEALTQAAPSCEQADNACRTAPGANMAQCSANLAGCQDTCSKEASACRTAPGANQSTCSANYAACLGVNPYN